MQRTSRRMLLSILGLSLAILATTEPASAHPGALGDGLSAGLAHPLTGLDHLLIIGAVGAWSTVLGGRNSLLLPLTFLGAMAAGALSAHLGLSIVGIESLIVASLVCIGLAMTATWHSLAMVHLVVAAAAFLHGFAHGAEMPVTADVTSYFTGFLVTTAGILMVSAMGTSVLRQALLAHPQRFRGLQPARSGAKLGTGQLPTRPSDNSPIDPTT